MKRVLFVDDEVNVLQGLKRMLRSIGTDWDMTFVDSPAQALEVLDNGPPFDVIVTDIRMPEMTGVELLQVVMKRHPETVRFAWTGHADSATMISASSITHQFLTKPCDPRTFYDLVSRAFALRDHLSNPALRELLLDVGTLPSLPAIYQEITMALQLPNVSIAMVAEIISKDVSISTKVLQIVNSASSGLRQPISSIVHAAAMLGLNNLRNLVLMAEVFGTFDTKGRRRIINPTELWNHSLQVAKFAAKIGKQESDDRNLSNECFTAGLLHDIGLVILATKLTDKLEEALQFAVETSVTLFEAEKEVIGSTHAEVGGFLLELWGLPDPIVEAVVYHNIPSASPDAYYAVEKKRPFSILTAVHVANYLCSADQFGQPDIDVAYMERLALAPQLETWWDICHQTDE
jgi:HD-like signal output (HDOD) protein